MAIDNNDNNISIVDALLRVIDPLSTLSHVIEVLFRFFIQNRNLDKTIENVNVGPSFFF